VTTDETANCRGPKSKRRKSKGRIQYTRQVEARESAEGLEGICRAEKTSGVSTVRVLRDPKIPTPFDGLVVKRSREPRCRGSRISKYDVDSRPRIVDQCLGRRNRQLSTLEEKIKSREFCSVEMRLNPRAVSASRRRNPPSTSTQPSSARVESQIPRFRGITVAAFSSA